MQSKKVIYFLIDTTKTEQTMQEQISEWVGKVRNLLVDYIKFLIQRLAARFCN